MALPILRVHMYQASLHMHRRELARAREEPAELEKHAAAVQCMCTPPSPDQGPDALHFHTTFEGFPCTSAVRFPSRPLLLQVRLWFPLFEGRG